ncbi:hypothetical protein AB0E77_22855 [Streptomyces sp. NPDC032940]|uniref:hypothetical protein n=1 Tax=Streptomyces sp. NPDC032940 TaxID=3155366 RepID=UPI0033C6F4B2
MRSSVLGLGTVRRAAVLTAAVALAVSAAPLTGTAEAHEAVTGSLSFGGEPGEYISGGQSYSYTPGTTEMFDISGPASESAVGATVVTPEGERWYLHMEAPYGQKLTSGTTYTNASSWPDAQPEDPKLELSSTDRSCDTGTGSFTISHIAYGPYGYISEVDATFERYCSGSTLPVRGELHARMAEPPAELAIGMELNTAGTVDTRTGEITVGGAVTCNKPASITLTASAYQTQKSGTASGSYEDLVVACVPGAPVPWSVSFPSNIDPTASFRPGDAVLRGVGRANDPDYPATATTGFLTADITLARS